MLNGTGLDVLHCDKCNDTGHIVWQDEFHVMHSRECECMAKRRSIRRLKNSHMEDLLRRYTFTNYETPDELRGKIKARAMRYVKEGDGWWLYVSGRSGSGKTHVCTAVCSALIEAGNDLYYMDWRHEITELRGLMNTPQYTEKIDKLIKVPVLYIDDFLKKGTEADVRTAFDIINARYANSKLRTIITSECTLRGLFDIDEALAGRIYERTRGGYAILAPNENWRMRELDQRAAKAARPADGR